MTDIIYEPSETGHYMTLYKKKNILLAAHNLNEGEELVAEMSGTSEAKVYNKSVQAEVDVVVLLFTNGIKMALNITNARIIAGLYGDKKDHWIGKSIQIYVGQARNPNGKGTVPGLKIRETIPDTGADLEVDYEAQLRASDSTEELVATWKKIPKHLMPRFEEVKNEMKEKVL